MRILFVNRVKNIMECTKIFTFKTEEQRKEIEWSCNGYSSELNIESKTIKVNFPDASELYGWAQVFKKWFGYVPGERVMNKMEQRIKIRDESILRMKEINPGDPITNICAGENNPLRHCTFIKCFVKTKKNKFGIESKDRLVNCITKNGSTHNVDIEVIYPGTLSELECEALFTPIWEAEYGQRSK